MQNCIHIHEEAKDAFRLKIQEADGQGFGSDQLMKKERVRFLISPIHRRWVDLVKAQICTLGWEPRVHTSLSQSSEDAEILIIIVII